MVKWDTEAQEGPLATTFREDQQQTEGHCGISLIGTPVVPHRDMGNLTDEDKLAGLVNNEIK